ncbi:IS110 family transposase, partial [Clostridium sp. DL1XJH146]
MLINDNIKIIKESTLIVGIDVAKNVHYASASDSRGIQVGKTISFNNDVEGINNLLKWINSLKLKFNKLDTIIGLEPTGHYWFNLHDFIADNFVNTQIVLVNPWDSKYMRKLNGNINKKTDSIDSIAIARSVKDGRFFRKSLHEGIFGELKDYMRLREKEIKSKTRVKNQITRWLDIAFPEFTKVFKDCFCNSALVLLEKYPTPKHVVETEVDDLLKTLRTKVSTSVGKKKLNQLKNAASKSIG